MKVLASGPQDTAWLVERTRCAPTAGFRGIKAIDSSGAIRGMVGFDLWTESAVQAHMAVDTPVAWRSLVPAVFEYPFLECGRELLLGIIPAHNERSWRLAERFGFRRTFAVRDGWAKGDDLLLLELRRDECRYLRRN